MTMRLGSVEIESENEVWSVRQKSTDDVHPEDGREIAFPEGELAARRYQKGFGGQLLMRRMFVTSPEEQDELSDEETFALQD